MQASRWTSPAAGTVTEGHKFGSRVGADLVDDPRLNNLGHPVGHGDVIVRFREIGYVQRDGRDIEFRGTYLAIASNDRMSA